MKNQVVLWFKKGLGGVSYCTIRLPDGSILHLHKNPYKTKKRHPDYIEKELTESKQKLFKRDTTRVFFGLLTQ